MERRLAAILAADMVGYSRLMAADETGTIVRQKAHREALIDPKIAQFGGRIVKTTGDGLLVVFPSVVDAVQCAVETQLAIAERESGQTEPARIRYRIGVNLGDIVIDGDDILGDGVNIAARLEGIAAPGGICLSDSAYQQLHGKLTVDFEDQGEKTLKNLDRPLRVWAWEGPKAITAPDGAPNPKPAMPAPAAPDRPTIAVLPFDNMSGDPEQEYFADGITEDIITELSRYRSHLVIARNSAFQYKGKRFKVQDAARDLGARYIVEGSIRKAGKRVRVTAQLIEAESGNHLWAERYDRDLEDIFAVQDEITQAIAATIPRRLEAAAYESGRGRPTESLTAYDYLLRGEYALFQGGFNDELALEMFEKAVETDPNYARAWIRLANWRAFSHYSYASDAARAEQEARRCAERALALDSGDARVQAIASTVYLHLADHERAEDHIAKAMALNPNDVEVLYRKAAAEIYYGAPREGLDWMDRVIRLDPHYPEARLEPVFDAHFMAGDYKAAIETFRRMRHPQVHMYAEYAAALALSDQEAEAREAVKLYEEKRPETLDSAQFIQRHLRICKQQADRERWLEGYRAAGFKV